LRRSGIGGRLRELHTQRQRYIYIYIYIYSFNIHVLQVVVLLSFVCSCLLVFVVPLLFLSGRERESLIMYKVVTVSP